jgi:hypothetical protein
MESYDTVTSALTGLKARGYNLDFNIAFDKLMCSDNIVSLDPNQFEITAVYRFEGDSNPDDEDVVYAVESLDGSIKGTFTSAFGLYADTVSTKMLQKLTMHKS